MEQPFQRILGSYDAGRPGPAVVVSGGVHGNEPAGAHAIRVVIQELTRLRLPLRGRLVGIAGNLAALSRSTRYVDRDLNRKWYPDHLDRIAADGDGTVEDREQLELLRAFLPLMEEADRPVVFLDLHSTSGQGPPFAAMADVLRNRPVAFAMPLPVVLGLEEAIDGTMLGYLCDLGHVGVAVEGGQHDDPETVRNHVSMIWLALVGSGALNSREVPDLKDHRRRLAEVGRDLPRVLEIRHRHATRDTDGFSMRPGFANFAPVTKGELLASDATGEIRAPETGLMMLPRYQPQGEDGYFLARKVSSLWLTLSAVLRHLRLHLLVPMLPGVARHPSLEDHFIVDGSVARYRTVQVFHLFGYRHNKNEGDCLVFSRRRPGFRRRVSPPQPTRGEAAGQPGQRPRP